MKSIVESIIGSDYKSISNIENELPKNILKFIKDNLGNNIVYVDSDSFLNKYKHRFSAFNELMFNLEKPTETLEDAELYKGVRNKEKFIFYTDRSDTEYFFFNSNDFR